MITDKDFEFILNESGVANELGHYENGRLHTAITSRGELEDLVQRAYDIGFQDGQMH